LLVQRHKINVTYFYKIIIPPYLGEFASKTFPPYLGEKIPPDIGEFFRTVMAYYLYAAWIAGAR
jgi:hypothetical protein